MDELENFNHKSTTKKIKDRLNNPLIKQNFYEVEMYSNPINSEGEYKGLNSSETVMRGQRKKNNEPMSTSVMQLKNLN